MANLPNFPLVDQLNEPTSDAQADENARNNCVPASIAAGLRYLTGQAFNGDQLKDAVYGQGYTGTMSASKFVSFCAAQGVKLYSVGGTQAQLVAALHQHLASGRPVLVTMPSNWGTAPSNPVSPGVSTHVGIACGESNGSIRVMNPWGGFWQDGSDAWWQARLCYGQVWPMEKVSANTVSGVPTGWKDDGKTLRAPDGTPVIGAMRAYVLGHSWDPGDTPMGPEQQVAQVEVGNPALAHPGVVQFFKTSGQLSWDGSFAGGAAWKTWDGQEELGLRRALSDTQASMKPLQDALSAANASLAQAGRDLTQAQLDLRAMTDQRDALAAKLATLAEQNSDVVALVAALKKVLGL